MAKVTHIFLKQTKGEPMVAVTSCKVVEGMGIENDTHNSPISPRQILITRKEDLDELSIPYGGLRENIIIAGLTEDIFQPGGLLCIGANVKIRLTFHCEPCKRIADVVPSMVAMLKRRGILGVICEGGVISLTDEATIQLEAFPPMSDIPYERFLNFVQYIPVGKVVTYKEITIGMGVAESYIRAIPKYIEKALKDSPQLPIHRIVDSNGGILDAYIPKQSERLTNENILVLEDFNLFSDIPKRYVLLKQYLWRGDALYLE